MLKLAPKPRPSAALNIAATASMAVGVPIAILLLIDRATGLRAFQHVIPTYHGAIFLGVAILATVVLWFALGELRTFEERAHQLKLTVREAMNEAWESEGLVARIKYRELSKGGATFQSWGPEGDEAQSAQLDDKKDE